MRESMGLLFGLSAECGSDKQGAELFEAHFHGFSFELITGKTSVCYTEISQDAELNWWTDIIPNNITWSGGPSSLEDAIDLSEAGLQLYTRLISAPQFRFAIFGLEKFMFKSHSELPSILKVTNNGRIRIEAYWEGLVLSESIWNEFEKTSFFDPFGIGYRWIPYEGERYSPLQGNQAYAQKLRALRDGLGKKKHSALIRFVGE
jgi:hypothetical protein